MAGTSSPATAGGAHDGTVTRQQWWWTALAGMASYLDAGSIVAIGAGLALWQSYLHLSNVLVGVVAALGPNAVGCAVGALIGGRLGDLLGRKRVYQYDLIVYAAGILLIGFAVNIPMLLAGTFIVGVAVGADVPTSLALVGELAPSRARGRLIGFTQVYWSLGPIVVLVLATALAPLGLLGIRIVILHLFAAAIVTWALRQGLSESVRWSAAAGRARTEAPGGSTSQVAGKLRQLLLGPNLAALFFTAIVYLFWNLAAGTYGIFLPYILTTVGAKSQAVSVAFQCIGFVLGAVASVLLYMRYADRGHRDRKAMWGVGAVIQVVAFGLFVVFPFVTPIILVNILFFGVGSAIAGEPSYKTWSQEMFPTLLRGTAQGITFGVARVLLGVWSFFVPQLASAGIKPVALLLGIFLAISGAVGWFFMPNTAGKSLEQIEAERAVAAPRVHPEG
jgi:MFS transporter, SP family, inositol transporter